MQDLRIPFWGRQFYRLYDLHFPTYRTLYTLLKNVAERRISRCLRQHVKAGMTVLDVGANIGHYSVQLASLVGPGGRVCCFEPSVENYAHLVDAVAGRGQVEAIRAAVGATPGSGTLILSDQGNIDHHLAGPGGAGQGEATEIVSIDSYCQHVSSVDFIKMDIQGYEFAAFQGMRDTIARSSRPVVLFEYWPFGLARAGFEHAALIELIRSLGLVPRLLDGSPVSSFIPEPENWKSYTDVVCVKE
ncbi:hypothetical protein JCM14635_38970 [Megalodesulfovibrio paquesii]